MERMQLDCWLLWKKEKSVDQERFYKTKTGFHLVYRFKELYKNWGSELGVVVPTYSFSTLGDEGRRISCLSPAWAT